MGVVVLPVDSSLGAVCIRNPSHNSVIGSTTGLVKEINEDRAGYVTSATCLRLCLADGHWGAAAAAMSVNHWLAVPVFPSSSDAAYAITSRLEAKLYELFGKPHMDPSLDLTPETSFLALEQCGERLRVVSYGDCRLLIVRNGSVAYSHATNPTWLGAFSYLGLRDRKSVSEAVIYNEYQLQPGDVICTFSDGIDECIYETPTIGWDILARLASDPTLTAKEAFNAILDLVVDNGAEDNATLAIIRYEASR